MKLPVLLLALALSSCSQRFINIQTTQHPKYNLKNFKFYSVASNDNFSNSIIEKELTKDFRKKNYIQDIEHSDFIVFYQLYDTKIQLNQYAVSNLEQKQVESKNILTSSLLIQVIHRESNELIWRGYTTNLPKNVKPNQLENLVATILKEVPKSEGFNGVFVSKN